MLAKLEIAVWAVDDLMMRDSFQAVRGRAPTLGRLPRRDPARNGANRRSCEPGGFGRYGEYLQGHRQCNPTPGGWRAREAKLSTGRHRLA